MELTSVFNPSSPQAWAIANLGIFMIIIAGVILAIIIALVTIISYRFRRKPGDDEEPRQVYGNEKLEIVWTIIPFLIVAALFILSVITMVKVNPSSAIIDKQEPDLVIIGHQWWWELHYPKSGVVSANEIHIPVGKKMLVRLESIDVIHDFWVPEVARKIDLVPGHPNYIWLEADEPGIYLGQCSEFCGIAHAHMRLRVIAHHQEEFDVWEKGQLYVPPTPRSGEAGKGAKLFKEKACMNCHSIAGTDAVATVGPNLTHLATRTTIGAGTLPNTPINLAKWLKNPKGFKPGALMPNMKLSDDEVKAIVAYLEALQ